MDIVTVLSRAVDRHGDRPFLFDPHRSVTFAEADRASNAAAHDLIGRGIAKGDTVALAASDRVSLWLAIIAVWKAGALPSLIDARTPEARLPYFVHDMGAKTVVAASELSDRLAGAGANDLVDLESLGADGSTADVSHHGPDSPLYLSYTSGTTGDPKGVVLLSEPVTLGASCIADRLQLDHRDILLTTTPISSSFQLIAALMPALHVGASVGLVAGSTTDVIWDVAMASQATVLVAYPLTLADIVNSPRTTVASSPFRVALSGGSTLAPRIKRDYAEKLGIALLESYGQSELGGFMALGAPHDPQELVDAGFAGRPLPDRLAFVGDESANEVESGQLGEVLVANGFFHDYRNKPDKCEEATRFGVLHTGDLGVAGVDGHLKVVGRLSEYGRAVERGGFLREVEDAYYEHPAVQHGLAVEARGVIEGFVEFRAGEKASPDELQAFVAERVPAALRPAKTTVLDEMPRTFSGKADRLKLAGRVGRG